MHAHCSGGGVKRSRCFSMCHWIPPLICLKQAAAEFKPWTWLMACWMLTGESVDLQLSYCFSTSPPYWVTKSQFPAAGGEARQNFRLVWHSESIILSFCVAVRRLCVVCPLIHCVYSVLALCLCLSLGVKQKICWQDMGIHKDVIQQLSGEQIRYKSRKSNDFNN